MTRTQRQRLSLFMSVILMIFTICQSQAMAMGLADATTPAMPTIAGCQDSHGDAPAAHQNCSGECQHLQQHVDSGTLPLADLSPAIIAFWLPSLVQDTGRLTLALLPNHDPVSDPPLAIRFQRFRI